MSINREEFFKWETTQIKVLNFLKSNRNKAFTPTEIAKAIKIKNDNVIATLVKLGKKHLALNKTPYWMINLNPTKKRVITPKKTGLFG